MRIVRQQDEVATQLFCPAQEYPRIVFAPRAAGPQGRLFMKIDSPQKNRRSVEQDIRATGFYRAKSDAIGYPVRLTGDLNFVEPRFVRRPQRQVRGKGNVRASSGICLEYFAESCFRNSNRDALLKFWSVKLYPAFDVSG